MSRHTLLVLAFEFPPLDRVSVHRSLTLARLLPAEGIRPVVVTADKRSLEAWFGRADEEALLQGLPAETEVVRIPCPRPAPKARGRLGRRLAHFLSVDEDMGRHWYRRLVAEWGGLVSRHRPDASYVTIPPFSMAMPAMRLASASRLPFIVDFRDNWSQMCNAGRQTWLHYRLVHRRERRVVEAAAAVIGVTAQLVADVQAAHPHVPASKFHVVPNGFDGDVRVPDAAPSRRDDAPFVVGYVGSFYYSPEARSTVMDPWWRRAPRHWLHYSPRREDWLYRSPYYFFRALAALFARRPEMRARVRVRFVGDTPSWLEAQVDAFGLADVVEHLGRLPHAQCLEFQAECDALLVTSAKVLDGRDYCIAGKTFEYLGTGRPILGVVAKGEQRDFLLESGMALVCDADDPEGSARVIEQLVDGPPQLAPNLPFLARFQRREMARKVADIVRSVARTPQRHAA